MRNESLRRLNLIDTAASLDFMSMNSLSMVETTRWPLLSELIRNIKRIIDTLAT